MKIGILSFAHLHAESYVESLRTVSGVEMIGIADDDRERGEHYAQRFSARLFPSYQALLAEQPDGVIVCSENARHRPLVELAAQAGAHVLCEKPLATTLEDAQAMIDACDQADVILMTAFPMRFSAPLLEIKSVLDQGGLGHVYACSTTNQGQTPKRYRDWLVDRELAGGGSVMDHTVHLVDLLRWYLESEVVEVYGQTNCIIHGDTLEVETGGLVMLTFDNGTFATIDCSWSRPPNYPSWGGLALGLVGERGVVSVDAFRQSLMAYDSRSQHPVWLGWGSDADGAMLAEFVAAIRERRPPRVTGYDGYKALEIALAVYRSAQLNQPVPLPSPPAEVR